MIEYISPSSLKAWEYDPEAWFRQRFCGARYVQTQPMAVGSAFDAYVKSYVSEYLFGRVAEFEFQGLFESQVSPEHWDFALGAGAHCFNEYKKLGSLGRLMEVLACADNVRMELQIVGALEGVPLLGRPDLVFSIGPVAGILDWKVNGYCSVASPQPGYMSIWPGGASHKRYSPEGVLGACRAGLYWEDQLLIYHYILGSSMPCLGLIEQLVWRNGTCRVASFRNLLQSDTLIQRIKRFWQHMCDGHVFPDLSLEESHLREATLCLAGADDELH